MTYFAQWPVLLFTGMAAAFLITLAILTLLDWRNG